MRQHIMGSRPIAPMRGGKVASGHEQLMGYDRFTRRSSRPPLRHPAIRVSNDETFCLTASSE
ncbi:hypothetical protein [Nocardia asiatica]|uniref:hypothetical protein n=1 Tax=Nocardia asiatica TaxID=209252 RepID=UPI0024560525|nr:hypothetical protein [Nocardia asiatica]